MQAAIRKAVIGGVAGLLIGPVAVCFLQRHEPPIEPKLLLASVCVGAFLGAAISFTAGGRSVSVFWLYFVLIGGGIAMIPWWYSGKTHWYYPLATIYWNSLPGKNAGVVLLIHTLISVTLAAIASRIYKSRRARVLKTGSDNPSHRRWYQFSLRSLLVLVALASIGMCWVTMKMEKARRQKAAVMAIVKDGGQVRYDYQQVSDGDMPEESPPLPEWLQKLLRDDLFANVVSASVETDAGLEHLSDLRNLKGLSLDQSKVTDAGLECLEGLNQLRDLDLSISKISDSGLQHIKGLDQLTSVKLSYANVTDAGLENLEAMSHLLTLNLGGVQVTGAGLAHIEGLTHLQHLTLYRTNVTDAGLKYLKALDQLQILDLSDTQVTDAGLEYLKGLGRLHELYLSGTKVTKEGVRKLQQALPHCDIH